MHRFLLRTRLRPTTALRCGALRLRVSSVKTLAPTVMGAAARRGMSTGGSGRVLVVADHDNKALSDATLNAVTAATKLGSDVSVLVAGHSCKAVADAAAKVAGVKAVVHADHAAYANALPENLSLLLLDLQKAKNYSHIISAATAVGKAVLPRVGVQLNVQPISDVIGIEGADTFVRPVYAGNALSTVKSKDSVKILTVRTTAFEKAAAGTAAAAVEAFAAAKADAGLTQWVSDEIRKSDRPALTSARVVISGGRALKNGANFKMLESLADRMGGAVGASRAAVDAGYVPNDMQIGQTGKVVAPELYVAVGISGAIQHLAGMKDSKTIVAINKDAEAPIFQVADYGLVGDLFTVIPELNKAVGAAAVAPTA